MKAFIRFMWLVHTRNRGRRVLLNGNERTVRQLWISALRRQPRPTDPGVHVGKHGPPEVPDRERRFRLLTEQVACALCGRVRPGEMLQASEMIDSHIRREGRVVLAVSTHMYKRSSAPPVFIGGVREENLRHDPFGSGAIE